jgi:hypothetical protein
MKVPIQYQQAKYSQHQSRLSHQYLYRKMLMTEHLVKQQIPQTHPKNFDTKKKMFLINIFFNSKRS